MKVKNVSYPHPVLGNEDDVRGSFGIKFFHKQGRDKILLRTEFDLKNKTIASLVRDKKAFFSAEVECNSTFFRKSVTSYERELSAEIDAPRLREQVAVKFFVRATEQLPSYAPEECHEDYRGFTFEINKGDVLAVGGATSFIAEKEFDPLRPAVSSFMAIRQGSDSKGPIVIDYGDPEKIIIKLSKTDWGRYQNIKGRKWMAPVLHSSIVLPVLADAVRMVHNNDEEASETHWFKRLEKILTEKRLSMDMPLDAAQRILSEPIARGLESL